MSVRRDPFESKVDRTGDHHLWLGSRTAAGYGQIRIDGRLRTAAQVAWELEHGDLPEGTRVRACPDEPACVRVDHLTVNSTKQSTDSKPKRAPRGGGSVAELGPGKWKITVDAGRDDSGRRRRLTRRVTGTHAQANQALAALAVDVAEGTTRPTPPDGSLTVNELIDWYIEFGREIRGLEHSTLVGYRDVYDHWLAPRLGNMKTDRVSPADLDNTFGHMRSTGLSRSRMNNARAVLSGAYKWGRRHQKVSINPVAGFELPTSTKAPRATVAPELDELLRLLDGADEHDPELAPVLKLAATTGMRRGELSGLRRNRLHLHRNELLVTTVVNDAGGQVTIKEATKNRRNRSVSLDEGTVTMLTSHLQQMDQRANTCGVEIPNDGFVFSLDPSCVEPMRPEFMTRRMRQLRKALGLTGSDFDATILALRKWTSTELMDAKFNPSTVSSRQGHTVQVLLHHYSARRRSADEAAAKHLGQRIHGRTNP